MPLLSRRCAAAMQGIQGIRSHSRRAAAPSSSPANTRADSSEQSFFDKLKAAGCAGGLCVYFLFFL